MAVNFPTSPAVNDTHTSGATTWRWDGARWGKVTDGAAGGVLSGTYPNPGFAVDMATQVELDDHINDTVAAHAGSAIGNTPAGNISATTVQAAINELDTEKEPSITAGTSAQYWRGDKSWTDFAATVRASVLTGLSTATNAVIAAGDTMLSALGKLQKQITDNLTTLTGHTGNTSNPHSVTKAQVGLGSVDNTSDANKPVSTAQAAADALKVSKSGDTMTGNLTVPSLNGGQLAGLRNKIINGKMEIAQRGTSFVSPATGVYTLDRFAYVASDTSALATVSQQADVPAGNEFQSSLRVAITTADTSIAAGDLVTMRQLIEGYNARDLIGRTFTLSFWVRSSKTGVHCVGLRNSGVDRSWVAEYTVNAANTWEQKSITVSGGLITAGTWDWTTGIGLRVDWVLAAGSTFQSTAGSWLSSSSLATSSQVNCLDTIGNIFAITGVQLEVGSVATPFEHRPFGMELALCQRYYYRVAPGAGSKFLAQAGYCSTASSAVTSGVFPVSMRSAPSALEQSGSAADYALFHSGTATVLSAAPTLIANTTNVQFVCDVSVASGLTLGRGAALSSNSANAYLGFSAEL